MRRALPFLIIGAVLIIALVAGVILFRYRMEPEPAPPPPAPSPAPTSMELPSPSVSPTAAEAPRPTARNHPSSTGRLSHRGAVSDPDGNCDTQGNEAVKVHRL